MKRIVEKLGGQIGVESVPGEGSLFFHAATPKRRPVKSLNDINEPLLSRVSMSEFTSEICFSRKGYASMAAPAISSDLRDKLLVMQRDEITSYHMYLRLAKMTADAHNSETLRQIADQEHQHYQTWKH